MTPQTLSRPRPLAPRDGVARRRTDLEASTADRRCLRAIRSGDESAFIELAGRHHGQMVRVARCYVGCPVAAQEVVQDAWAVALRALDGVDERTSPRLWLFRILTRVAKHRAGHGVAATRCAGDAAVGPAPGMDVEGRWTSRPAPWGAAELDRLAALGARGAIDVMIRELPLDERLVLTLRDGCRWDEDEVAHLLAISSAGQRTLLHSARRRLHAALAVHLRPAAA